MKARDAETTVVEGPRRKKRRTEEYAWLAQGWGWPEKSRKAHFFKEGSPVSACGKWVHAGTRENLDLDNSNNCAACLKLVLSTSITAQSPKKGTK